jgi:acyl carrier protein
MGRASESRLFLELTATILNIRYRMNHDEVRAQIEVIVNRLITQKGLAPITLDESSRFLGGDIPIDSLDLAVVLTELERAIKKDPFKDGFKNFRTVGELTQLYVE